MTPWQKDARLLECVGDTQIAVRHHAENQSQDIVVVRTPLGECLARFLAALDDQTAPGVEQADGESVYVIQHSPGLDRRLVQIIDLFIDLRWLHPGLAQLEVEAAVLAGEGRAQVGGDE